MLERWPWLLAGSGLALAIAVIVVACGSDEAPPPEGNDSAPPLVPVSAPICPTAEPPRGSACFLPDGTTCAFGACGSPIAECRGGAWRYGGNPPPRPPCPGPEPPPVDSVCPPCWPAGSSCTYGDCDGADASANTALAECADGRWTIRITACVPRDGDGDASTDPPDGADVQGDAGADAD